MTSAGLWRGGYSAQFIAELVLSELLVLARDFPSQSAESV
jgi:hypothetical protein